MQTFTNFLQGSSVAKVPYKIMDMENLVQDSIGDIPEDDGPHTSNINDPINFQTVDHPEKYINQQNSEGNRDSKLAVAPRNIGKPMKTFRKKAGYGVEDLSGAVASIASENTILSFKAFIAELKKMDNPCWKGYKAYGTKMKNGKEVPNCVPIDEGSARGGYTRKGIYAKKNSEHLKQADQSEKTRGVEQKPSTDARKYSWTHLQGYNKGPEDHSSEKKRAASLKNPKKKVAVKLPVTGKPNERMAAILNHPHYKKLVNKHA